jgi:hypothetical protein
MQRLARRAAPAPLPEWGLAVALPSGLPVLWHNWFYSTAPFWIFAVDAAHQLIGHAVAGAILAGWRSPAARHPRIGLLRPLHSRRQSCYAAVIFFGGGRHG